MVIPVVQHNTAQHADARHCEYLFLSQGKTPVSRSGFVVEIRKIILRCFHAVIQNRENLIHAVCFWWEKVRLRGIKFLELGQAHEIARNTGNMERELSERHGFRVWLP